MAPTSLKIGFFWQISKTGDSKQKAVGRSAVSLLPKAHPWPKATLRECEQPSVVSLFYPKAPQLESSYFASCIGF
ncbi:MULTISPECIES: hypothetical protein [Moorena]|uniref:hypothetical protein n=1 Tax=Moorena TaxID=1155738 RepID=UPI0002E4B31B|nr:MULTISPECIES: hypothetical protein [Moorena]NEQ13045.1 hypothetical protein [Moorena sp. SIO3E2]NEP31364.1 hypothetical protein [Moorena sp. SIO3B2]NEP66528.1 hypothetical protein [Moorena sp. SIO3A5]NER86286.1 hypothetical protein [Moorena sp. SIO3A2]NES43452.1 hypothetical protein [Moorena sp. SIO2C4]